jgi:predicted Zn-dependent protease
MLQRVLGICLAGALLACATSPLGRRQLRLFPDDQMSEMGIAAYDKMKQEMPRTQDASANSYVRCVADAVTAEVTGRHASSRWEVTVFQDPSPNAFALPGGKIGVHTGLLKVARNQDQLATVLGHEVAHVLAEHGNERVSTAFATQTGIDLAGKISGSATPTQQQLLGLLGLGAQVGVLLPFSRAQESEADALGLDLMARAGFDPRESVQLWKNMSDAGGGQPPEFLSTHPAHGTRIENLKARMSDARVLSEQARAQGRRPACS